MFLGKKKLCFAIVLLSAILFSLPLYAETLTIDNVYFGYDSTNYYENDGNPDTNGGISGTYVDENNTQHSVTSAGTFQVNYGGYDTWGFCVQANIPLDLSQPTNSYDYTTENPADYNSNLTYVAWLLDAYGQDAYSTTNGKATFGAALQLATWEVLYDLDVNNSDSYNLDYDSDGDDAVDSYAGTDNFFYKRDEVDSIDEFVNDFYDDYIEALIVAIAKGLDSSYVSSGNYVVAELVNRQDIIVNVVPEPTTALLLGFGLLGLCAAGRKRT